MLTVTHVKRGWCLNQSSSNRSGKKKEKKRSNSGYVFKVESTKSADRFDKGVKES